MWGGLLPKTGFFGFGIPGNNGLLGVGLGILGAGRHCGDLGSLFGGRRVGGRLAGFGRGRASPGSLFKKAGLGAIFQRSFVSLASHQREPVEVQLVETFPVPLFR